ncbi:MAG: hypothetical protein KAS01_00720 [Candidatus Pacebacteria bacterium]|nr:hypothetical protein [Candidatus Paceibacterota bacterium]
MNEKTKTFQKFALLFLVILVGVSVPQAQAHAQAGVATALSLLKTLGLDVPSMGQIVVDLFQFLIYGIGLILLGIIGIFVEIAAWLVDVFLDPKIYVGDTTVIPNIPGVLTSNSILIGWTVVRDICNMFFMFFLLIVAFGTMLRSKSINIKAILPKIIISLFLINFSMVFAHLIIDISQFFMIEISAWMPGGFSAVSQSLSTIPNGFKLGFTLLEDVGAVDTSMIVNVIFAIIFSVCLVFVYLMLACFLLIRLTYFAVLIVFSPVAFLGIAFPGLSKYSSQWWQEITKWAIFGPVFIFFVYLSTTMANELVGTTYIPVSPEFGWFDKIALLIIPAVVPLAILLMAPAFATKSGAAGAGSLVGGRGGLGNISMGSYGIGKWGVGKAKQAGGAVTARNPRIANTIDKARVYKQEKLSKIPLIGKGLALQDKANQQKGKQEKIDNRLNKYGGDLGTIDVDLAMKGDNIDKAIGLKAAAAQGKLGNKNAQGIQKYDEHFASTRSHLSEKDIKDLSNKNLQFSLTSKASQERIKAPTDENMAKDLKDAFKSAGNDKNKQQEIVKEQIMREKVAEREKEGDVHKIQGLGGEMESRAFIQGQTKEGQKNNVRRLAKDEQDSLAKSLGKNVRITGDTSLMKAKLKIDGKLDEVITLAEKSGNFDSKDRDSVLSLTKGLSIGSLSGISGEKDLSRLSEVATHNQFKNLLKAGEDEAVGKMKQLLIDKQNRIKGVENYTDISDQEIKETVKDLRKQITSN